MFVDKAKINVKSGDGGNGCVAFRREKFIPRGGPSGGDGGRGGDVTFVVDPGMRTLMDFKHKVHFKAGRGEHGQGSNMAGRDAEDLYIRVPPGTIVKDETGASVLADLTSGGQTFVIARGGRGGRGNARFATSVRQAPRFAEPGKPGEERWVVLELKLLADVGIIGFPNAGKSTLLSRVTNARPKIADYEFTTISPNLGVVELENGQSFVLADIPGLIEGAHEGKGLGHEFLRHVERTRVLLHMVDAAGTAGRDPVSDFHVINREIALYTPRLAALPQVVALNKMDLPAAGENASRLRSEIARSGFHVFEVSAVTGQGIRDLMFKVVELLREAEQVSTSQPETNGISGA
ncbi:MAG: GTPase ObgE [Firmicutes bacterium]|nr:GTPase ObgE [Bacillota bacterium]